MDERALREIRAVLEADLRVSGAATLAELRRATEDSLASLCRAPHDVEIVSDRNAPNRVNVTIHGPELTANLAITFQTLPVEPSTRR